MKFFLKKNCILFAFICLIQDLLGLSEIKPLDSTSGYQTGSPINHFRGNDNFHTGRSAYSGTASNSTRCKLTLDNLILGSPAIDSSGNIYVGTGNGASNYFYSISSTCTQNWNASTGQIFAATPAIGSDGTIYVADLNKYLRAFDSSTGSLIWKFQTYGEVHSSPLIGSDGTIYMGDYSNTLFAVYPSGSQKWSYGTANSIHRAMPAISSDNLIYVLSYSSGGNTTLFAINADTKAESWDRTINGEVQSSPAIGSDGTIYVASYDYSLYALDSTAGSTKWSYKTGGSIKSSPAIAGDGTIYIGSFDYNLYAIYSTGSLKWSYTTGNEIQSSPVIDQDGVIYIGSNDNYLHAIYSNGSIRWKYKTSGIVTSSAAIAADGTVFIGSNDYSLYAINTILPTATPTRSPTRKPTRTPTASPTSYLVATVQIAQTFQGANASDFLTTAGETVFQTTVIDILSSLLTLHSSDVNVVSATDDSVAASLRIDTRLLRSVNPIDSGITTKLSIAAVSDESDSSNVMATLNQILSSSFQNQASSSATVTYNINFPYLDGASGEPTTTSASIVALLKAAVTSGSFTSKLQSFATASGATGLIDATAGDISSSVIIDTLPTINPTQSPAGSNSSSSNASSNLSTGAIVGIVIGVVALALVMMAFFFYYKSNNKQYGNDRSNDITSLGGSNNNSNYLMSVVSNDKGGYGDEPYAVNSYYDYESIVAGSGVGQSHNSNKSGSNGTNTTATKKQAIVLYQPQFADSNVEMQVSKSARVYPIKWTDLKVNTPDPRDAIIGKGSFGVVFRAVLTISDNAEVVVKVMKQTGRAKDDKTTFRTAFEECRIIKEAESKMVYKDCIVKVYGIADGPLPADIADAMNVQTAIGIVLRYEGGGTLTDRIHPKTRSGIELQSNLQSQSQPQLDHSQSSVISSKSNSALIESDTIDMKEKIRLITGLARGLVELHSAGIVHGDIKPDNILLSSDDPPEVRLADFGLARIREEDDMGVSSLNETAHTKGTLLYCAPEMMVNPYEDVATVTSLVAKASRKSDMYAFALVSWEILTGLKPFDDVKRETTLAMKVHQGERPPISKIPADCPKKVIDMIQLCWDRDRFMRESAVKCFSKLQYEYRQLTNVCADVCLSYHESNRAVCEYYYHRLTQLGCKVCILEKEKSITDNHSCITSCQIIVAFLNIAYQEDDVCMTELRKARQQCNPPKPVFPVFTETDYVKWTDQDIDYLCQIRSEKQKRWDVSALESVAAISASLTNENSDTKMKFPINNSVTTSKSNTTEEERNSLSPAADIQMPLQKESNGDFSGAYELNTSNINIISDGTTVAKNIDTEQTGIVDNEEDIYNHTNYNIYVDDLHTVINETLKVHKEKYLEKLIEFTTHQQQLQSLQQQQHQSHIHSSKGSALNNGYTGLSASAGTQKQPSNISLFGFSKKGGAESLYNFSSSLSSSASSPAVINSPRSSEGNSNSSRETNDNNDISRGSFVIMGSNDGLRGSNNVGRFGNGNNVRKSHDTNSGGGTISHKD